MKNKRESIKNKIFELIKDYYNYPNDQDLKRIPISTLLYDSKEVIAALESLLDGWISQGKNVAEFEKLFSKKIGVKHGIATNSGSSANLIALNALREVYDIKPGDEVILPAATFATVAMPILQLGLIPVYVDVERNSLNIDPVEIEKAITNKTKIIMPVHTLGLPADMEKISIIAKKYKILIFEDCCEAHGASIDKKLVGSWGNISAFSFFVAHNMTTGEGGMILTDNDEIAIKCRSLREFGRYNDSSNDSGIFYNDKILKDYDKRYVFSEVGYNMRMTDICGALGIEQLKKLDDMNFKRKKNAIYLNKIIKRTFSNYFELPFIPNNFEHSYYTFSLTLTNKCQFTRRELCEHLENNNIETRPMMAGSLPDQPGLRGKPSRIQGTLKNSRYIRDKTLFIGIHPMVTKKHIDYLVQVIKEFISNNE